MNADESGEKAEVSFILKHYAKFLHISLQTIVATVNFNNFN